MTFPYLIQTIDEPMCSYSAMVFGFLFAAIPTIVYFSYTWVKREFQRVDRITTTHDEFVSTTLKTMGKMQTDVAVINGTMKGQAADIHEIKDSMAGINQTMWDQFVK